jgi:hypothetical protein
MQTITESEFDRITTGIFEDRESIIKHNPIGTPEEVLMWMLLSCLISYLSIPESEVPCFPGRPDVETYSNAVRFILEKRKGEAFDLEPYIARLTSV